MPTPKVTLRNVRYFPGRSEETAAFEAELSIGGKVVGSVSNEGRGGNHRYIPSRLVDRMNTIAHRHPDRKDWWDFEPGDALVSTLLQKWLAERELGEVLKRKTLFVRAGRLYEAPAGMATEVKLRHPGAIVLNTLPHKRAVELYVEAVLSE